MSDELKRYEAVQAAVEQRQREADRAQGAYDELLKQLADEYNCKTVKQAAKLLAEFETAETAARKLFSKALDRFEKEHGEYLND